MQQMNLLEMHDIQVSCGDPERDKVMALERKRGLALVRAIADLLHCNIQIDYRYCYDCDRIINCDCGYDKRYTLFLERGVRSERYNYRANIGYYDSKGQMWLSELLSHRNRNNETRDHPTFQIKPFAKSNKYVPDIIMLQSPEDLNWKIRETRPYAWKMCTTLDGIDIRAIAMAPQLEQLKKAGFRFVDRFLDPRRVSNVYAQYFNRLCQPGKNLKEIFKTPKAVWTALKDETDIEYWDVIRRMFKKGTISTDTLKQVIDSHYDERDLNQIAYILRQRYNGKNIFTFDSLMNYLRRLDMYEAIESSQAFWILKDYLQMCGQLGMEPKIDGDSLKREHDVTARTLRNKRNEDRARELNESCQYLAQYNYENDEYLIRGIRDYDDLIDEAKQQHNCVASYAQSIARRTSLIFVLRNKSMPNRSYITVELSPDLKHIRQRFLAYNQPVRDKSVTDFLDDWLEYINKLNGGKEDAE